MSERFIKFNEELLPCPFCGKYPDVIVWEDDDIPFWRVVHSGCQSSGPLGNSEEQAIELWNNRPK